MLVDEISTKVKRWAIILTVETVGFLAHMGYNKNGFRQLHCKVEEQGVLYENTVYFINE